MQETFNLSNQLEKINKSLFNESDLYKCVGCGFCLQSCPTYIETGLEAESPRGRIALMKAVNEERIGIVKNVTDHWDLCIQCRACEIACPSGVEYGKLINTTKILVNENTKKSKLEILSFKLGFLIIEKKYLLFSIGYIIKFYKFVGLQSLLRSKLIEKLFSQKISTLEKKIPELSNNFFFNTHKKIPVKKGNLKRGKISLLVGCVMCITDANAIYSTIRVLNFNGYEVIIPKPQKCCGAIQNHAGYQQNLIKLAKNNIDSLLECNPDYIVSCSAGCGAQLKEYIHLFEHDPSYKIKAEKFSNITKDIHELLVRNGYKKPKGKINSTVTFQSPCHLSNAQKITIPPIEILQSIPAIKYIKMNDKGECCGAGGIYSITQSEMSNLLGKKKALMVFNTGSNIVTTANPGCAIQLRTHLNNPKNINKPILVNHVIELLDKSYTLEENTQ